MSSRPEKNHKLQNKHHQILRDHVQENNNKTCADCLAQGNFSGTHHGKIEQGEPDYKGNCYQGKGGQFRCAGIHRNLGVHISKVKSVDLDSWTHEQVEHILKWGNKQANEYYECYLLKEFARPQGNSAVESFIRSKYERRLYIKKDGEPAANPESTLNRLKALAENEADAVKASVSTRRERPEKKEVAKSCHPASDGTTFNASKQAARQSMPEPGPVAGERTVPSCAVTLSTSPTLSNPTQITKPSPSFVDLLTLDNSPAPAIEADVGIQTSQVQPMPVAVSNVDLLNFWNSSGHFLHNVPAQNGNLIDVAKNDAPKSSKESILSLYGNSTASQQPVYGVPGGLYMARSLTPHQQQPFVSVSASGSATAAYGYPRPTQMMALQAQMQVANRMVASQTRPGSSMAYPATVGFVPLQGGDLVQQQAARAYFQTRQTGVPAPPMFGVGPGCPTLNPHSGQPRYPSAAYGGVAATQIMDPSLTLRTNMSAGARTPQLNSATGQNLLEWGGGNQALAGVTYGQPAVMANGNLSDFRHGGSDTGQGHTMRHQLWN